MAMKISRVIANRLRMSAVAALALAAVPGSAHAGFFEDLFGGGQPAASAPTYAPAPTYEAPPAAGEPYVIHRPRKKVVVDEEKPVRQKTTDLWHDKTLRSGDAVMMKDGLHVYSGAEGGRPVARNLPRLENSRDVSTKQKVALLAMDGTHNDPLKTGASPDTIASGRSAAVGSSISAGYLITDARGKSLRYVGP